MRNYVAGFGPVEEINERVRKYIMLRHRSTGTHLNDGRGGEPAVPSLTDQAGKRVVQGDQLLGHGHRLRLHRRRRSWSARHVLEIDIAVLDVAGEILLDGPVVAWIVTINRVDKR